MTDAPAFEEPFYPVPPAAMDADPVSAMRELFYRVARLEQSLQEARVQAAADLADVLLAQVSLSDDLTAICEEIGVPRNAQYAMLARSITSLGQKVMAILKHHQVEPIEVVGRPLNPAHSDVVREELRRDVAPGTVLREERVGYTWRGGVLRRAQVVVSTRTEERA